MSSAMAVAQVLNIPTPSEDTMVARYKTTDSVKQPGYKMYAGQDTEDGAYPEDAVALIQKYWDVSAELKQYGTQNPDGSRSVSIQDSQDALGDLEAALARNQAVMVTVDSDTIWTATNPSEDGAADNIPNYIDSNHAVVVIAVDLRKGQVILNDSGPAEAVGKGEKVPIGAFMRAWQINAYEMATVKANNPPSDV
jgi:hypothetical protein